VSATATRAGRLGPRRAVAALAVFWACSGLCATACSDVRPAATTEDHPPKTAVEDKEKAIVLTPKAAWTIYEKYLGGWRAISAEQRDQIAAELIAEDVRYKTRNHESGGRQTIVGDMETFQSKFPSGHFDIGDVSAHHDVALLTWILVKADGEIFARGHDQLRVRPDGKIAEIVTFAPSVESP
jgi:hypothetical protein